MTSETRCGCACNCHEDEDKPEWPGPCAACCDPELGIYDCVDDLLAHIDA